MEERLKIFDYRGFNQSTVRHSLHLWENPVGHIMDYECSISIRRPQPSLALYQCYVFRTKLTLPLHNTTYNNGVFPLQTNECFECPQCQTAKPAKHDKKKGTYLPNPISKS